MPVSASIAHPRRRRSSGHRRRWRRRSGLPRRRRPSRRHPSRRHPSSGGGGEKECRLPTAFACHCQLLWFISSETVLHQDLQLRHPCASCAVLSRGFRCSDFGGFRALEVQACSLSCICCSSCFANMPDPTFQEIPRSVLRPLRWWWLLSWRGAWGHLLQVLRFCLWHVIPAVRFLNG